MIQLPDSIRQTIAALAKLPSIGPRQATRMAFSLIQEGPGEIKKLSADIDNLADIKLCAKCFFVHMNSGKFCTICESPARRKDIILVVEKETDLLSIENTGKFTGRYFVLGQIPRTGTPTDVQKERMSQLTADIEKECNGEAAEIIMGLNPTAQGDFHFALLSRELAGKAKKITRLARGLPTGGEIEFADDETLGSALIGRG